MCFDYDGYNEFGHSRFVTTRKPHRCGVDECHETIPAGSRVLYSCGKYERDFFSYYTCEQCQREIYSIVAREIKEGCHWNVAWCPLPELKEYLRDAASYGRPVEILAGTLEQVRKHLDELWANRRNLTNAQR